MRPIPRGKSGRTPPPLTCEAADSHIRCRACGGWIDVSDLGAVVDHCGPLPHPAIDQPQ